MLALFASLSSFAQKKPATKANNKTSYYATHPVWIDMMDDPNVNYYEAVKAFNLFWQNRELPVEEHELFTASEKEQKNVTAKKAAQKGDTQEYAFQYKKFKHWQERSLPFVKPDSTVMSAKERLEIWKQQQLNRK